MTDNEIIKELQCAAEWFTEHGRNTNTAIVGICNRAVDLINRQKVEIERLEAFIIKKKDELYKAYAILEEIENTINPLPFVTDFDRAIKTQNLKQ